MDTICIYHDRCSDGFGAAVVVYKAYGNGVVEFVPGIYSQEPPDVTNKHVILVDFCYKRNALIKMSTVAKSVLVLDHHKSVQNDLKNLPDNIRVVYDVNCCGAVITWKYYFPNTPIPKLLLHIQDRDLWQFKLENSKEILAALNSYDYDFERWLNLFDNCLDRLVAEGKSLVRKETRDIKSFIQSASYFQIIAGYTVPVINIPDIWASEACNLMCQDYAFAASYYDKSNFRVYSLRSHKGGTDVSDIAKCFGGGGHENSAGFRIAHNKLHKLGGIINTLA